MFKNFKVKFNKWLYTEVKWYDEGLPKEDLSYEQQKTAHRLFIGRRYENTR